MTEQAISNEQANANQSEKNVTQLVYALQAMGLIIGLTFIAAVVINYVKKGDLRSEVYLSHFRWQIRTFWFSLMYTVIGMVLTAVFIGAFILLGNAIWVVYRVAKGWIRMNDGKGMYDVA